MSDSTVGQLAALGTAILWTFSAVFLTAAGRRIGSLAVTFLRLLISGVLLLACAQLATGRCLPAAAGPRTWLLLVVSGFLGNFCCNVCLFKAMLLIGPRRALLVYALVPPITALVSFSIGDVLTPRQWAAMGVTLAGVAWVVLERPNGDSTSRLPSGTSDYRSRSASGTYDPASTRRGIALALFAAATSAVGMVLSRDVMLTYPDPVGATLIRAVAALPGYFVLITAWRRWPAMLAALRNPPAMTTLTIGSIMGPLAGAVLVMIAFRHSTAGVVTTITATMPVLILPLSILVYHERIGLRAVGGAVLAVAGVALLML